MKPKKQGEQTMKKKTKATEQTNLEKKREQPPHEEPRANGLKVKSQLSPGEHIAGGDHEPEFP